MTRPSGFRIRLRLGYRARLILATSALSVITLSAAFVAVAAVFDRAQERQLDAALEEQARREAAAVATSEGEIVISDQPVPATSDLGRFDKHAAIYDQDGRLLARTANLGSPAPTTAVLAHQPEDPFDFWLSGTHLRGVMVPVPQRPGWKLLMAAPRTDIDDDDGFLRGAMIVVAVLAAGWTVLVAAWVVHRMTRVHLAVGRVARRVAGGDLAARVGSVRGAGDVEQLAQDLDAMIDKLAELLEAQRRFIAHAAHELRSPLTALQAELSLALRRPRDNAEYRATIVGALDASRTLKHLAEDLLALVRSSHDPPAATDVVVLGEVVKEAWSLAAAHRPDPPPLNAAFDPPDLAARGRGADLVRLFRNLLENALEHGPSGAAVTVVGGIADGHAVVRVVDAGPGVTEADRPYIFMPFYRGHRAQRSDRGAGLGLAIAREIARSHGGDLVLDVDVPATSFCVRLPSAEPGDANPP